jgi:hypothetical protein
MDGNKADAPSEISGAGTDPEEVGLEARMWRDGKKGLGIGIQRARKE